MCKTGVLRICIQDAITRSPVACWLEITDTDGVVLDDWHVTDVWRGFPCGGEAQVTCRIGNVRIRARFRLSHQEVVQSVIVKENETHSIIMEAMPWVPFEGWGYFAGESHNHINAEWTPPQVSLYARAFGLRYINLCQGWMQESDQAPRPTGQAIATQLREGSTCGCHLHFGAERPKTRYGHVWWINLKPFKDPFGEYIRWHDSPYVDMVNRDATDPGDIQRVCPLRNELPLDTWRRFRRDGAACVAAHPTSWWLKRPDDQLIVTNISAELVFSLLCGEPPDALAVMGYDPDQIFYQNLWFHILNEGYPLAGCGETDGSLRGAHHIGQIITYTQMDAQGPYAQESCAHAIRAGCSVMSSGPFVHVTLADDTNALGKKLPADGRPHALRIRAWSAPEPREALTWIAVYRNGKPWQIRDLRADPPRHVDWTLAVKDNQFAWYVVKAYGRDGPDSVEDLDVMQYARACETIIDTRYRQWKQVALTNPVYVVPEGWTPPEPVRSMVRMRLVNYKGCPMAHFPVRVMLGDDITQTCQTDAHGNMEYYGTPAVRFLLGYEGDRVESKSIFLDYQPVHQLMENLFTGRWRTQAPAMQPGQVPWSAFQWHAMRKALETVQWTLQWSV